MNRYGYVLVFLLIFPFGSKCLAQATDSSAIVNSLTRCWRALSHEYSNIYGLEEEEIKRYSKQRVCITHDSIDMYFGVSYAPKFAIRKVNAEDYAKNNFDCNKQKLGISVDSVFEIVISSVTRPLKNEKEHKMTNIIAYDGNCIYVVVDGVIFKMFDADVKIQARNSN